MKISYSTNYSGYVPILRSVLLLVKAKTISISQLGAYIYFVMQADYDARHKHYGIILRDDKELANEFGINLSTVNRQRNKLIKTGLLKEKNGITMVTNYYMFELEWVKRLAKLPALNLQELFAKSQEDIADFKSLIANLQGLQPQNTEQSSSIPSKEESSFPRKVNDESISDNELDRIITDIDSREITSSLTTNTSQKTLDQMDPREQLLVCKEIFGEGTRWG